MTKQMHVDTLKKLDRKMAGLGTADQATLISFMKEFKDIVGRLEPDCTRQEIISYIPGIRNTAAHSPFVYRAQNWPKGYQGDFETIEHIISGKNKAVPGTFGHLLEDFFLRSDISKQHLNKVNCQSELIAKAIDKNPNAKIMSIGCGTSEDIKMNIKKIKGSSAEITIVDSDMDAINYSLKGLAGITENIKTVHGNIYKIVRTLKDKYDLVLIGGVFDYLSDKAIVRVLSSLKEHLNNAGIIFFTNIKKDNVYRVYMEYLSDWILIERSDKDIQKLLMESGLGSFDTSMQLDETDLTYLVEIKSRQRRFYVSGN